MRRRIDLVVSLAVVGLLALACSFPLDNQSVGRVSVDFSSYGGSSRAAGIPVGITSIDIFVKASGMADISVTLTTPALSTTIDVPAGPARSFVVLAKDSGGVVKYKGQTVLDIQAGAVHELSVSMAVAFALSYDANGAVSGAAPATLYLKTGEAITIAPNSGGLTRLGYSFDGWNTQADGLGTDYAPGAAYTMGGADQSLFAQWVATPFTITYHLNGGVNDPGNPATYTILSSLITLIDPTFAGNTFLGWFSDAALTVPIVSIPAGSTGYLDIYAKWNTASFNVIFDKNAALAVGTMTDQAITSGASAALVPNSYIRTGYFFTGWGTITSGPVVYADIALYTMGAADVTLYAQWAVNTYIVSFDAQGGTPTPSDEVVTYDGTYGTYAGATRTGYTFSGWWTAPNGTGTQIIGGTIVSTPSDHTLYAYWTPNNYQVVFNSNGGTGGLGPQNMNFGTTNPLLGNTFTRVGYTFTGWGDNPGGPVIYANMAPFTMNVTGATLFAQWTINNYSLVYDLNGGAGTLPGGGAYNFGQNFSAAVQPVDILGIEAVVSTGITCRFIGWNDAANGSGISYIPGNVYAMPAQNLVLYAQYQNPAIIVGQVGPAGGMIFYDQGSIVNGWQYLETSMSDQAGANVQVWSNVTATLGTTGTLIGDGLTNTAAIIGQVGHASSAALLCDAYSQAGYTDWYLPSMDELNWMYNNLHLSGLGNFAAEYYWCSSESATVTYAWRLHFNTGATTETIKTDIVSRVRAIRRF